MAAVFQDLADFLSAPHLDLPIRGVVYVIEDPDSDTAIRLQNLVAVGRAVRAGKEVAQSKLDDAEELDLYDRLLGKTVEKMRADGVKASEIKRCAMTVMAWVLGDEGEAMKQWHATEDDDPEGEARLNRATRRAIASQASGSTTRKRASTSGTRAGKKSRTP